MKIQVSLNVISLGVILSILPAIAQAHIGHLGEVAGHDHWVAGAAIGLAVAAGIWAAAKGRKEAQSQEPEEEDNSEEVPA